MSPPAPTGVKTTLSWTLTLCSVFLSILVVPVGLVVYFARFGAPVGGGETVAVASLVVMLPGILMGSTALWVAAWS